MASESRSVIIYKFDGRLVVEIPEFGFRQDELVCDAWKIRNNLYELDGLPDELFGEVAYAIEMAIDNTESVPYRCRQLSEDLNVLFWACIVFAVFLAIVAALIELWEI